MNLNNPTIQKILMLLMFGSVMTAHAAPLSISDSPLFLTTNVAPNVTLTLDDSGSMARAYTPDICGANGFTCGALNTHRYPKSSYFNPLYYNPAITYKAPVGANGVALTTTFNQAWVDGYSHNLAALNTDSYDLATQYRPTARLTLASSADLGQVHDFMEHYTAAPDLTVTLSYATHADTGPMVGVNSGSNAPYYAISDFINQDSSASGNDPGTNLISVTVNGTASSYVGTFTGACNNGNDPDSSYQYKTQRSGSTLTFCFRDSDTMYGKTVVVSHKVAGSGTAPIGATDFAPAYYYVFNEANAGCAGTAAEKRVDDDCYSIKLVSATSGIGGTDERQNFANWYSFYRTRNLATIASASLAFTAFDSSTRVAWQGLNSCRGDAGLVTTDCEGWEATATNFGNGIQPFTGTHKSNFYTWLFRLRTGGGTPLRASMQRVGEYYSTTGDKSPYDDDLSTVSAAPAQTSCRKNFHILMTDGIWNGAAPASTGNADGSLTAPYSDTNSDSLADVAYKYWSTDLTSLNNNLKPYMVEKGGDENNNPKNNPATWQHMVNFTVGLGLTPYLSSVAGGQLTYGDNNPATPDTYTGSYSLLKSGALAWPVTGADLDGNVADLWHAALNSRGQFFSAESPTSLVSAFQAVRNAIESSTPSAAALAANSTSTNTGALVYQAVFDGKDWSGDLRALPVGSGGVVGSAAWNAATKLPAAASRNIFTISGGVGTIFNWSSLTSGAGSQQAYLNTNAAGVVDTDGSDRLDWLRGVQLKELTASNPSGIFRARATVPPALGVPGYSKILGDIVNSDPAFAYKDDFGYASQGSPEAASYTAYVTGKSGRTPAVFVGGNDGMLHAFRADTGNAQSGVELFAYVPNAVYPNLSKLTDPAYTHKYYVDGGPTVGDAYLSSSWTTVLVGGLGAGGRAIYALNVSNVGSPSASMVKWEFTDSDLGLTYSKPQIARLNNGKWVAIFGNGYNSPTGNAFLYVVDLQDGTLLAKMAAGSATSNGLSTPGLRDINNDKVMDFAYAGDLQGNLWKFDLTSFASPSIPQFIARNASNQVQPITAQPVIGGHSSGNVLIYFGTGQYLQSTDPANTDRQTFYAIWDNGSPITTTSRSELQVQTIVAQTSQTFTTNNNGTPAITSDDTTVTKQLRETSANSIDWSVKRGWYMDFDEPSSNGERIVSQALLKYGRVIFITAVPSANICNAGGDSWLMELAAETGARTPSSIFDFNEDGNFDSSDNLSSGSTAAGVKLDVGIARTPAWFTGPSSGGGDSSTVGTDFKVTTGISSGGTQSLRNKGLLCATPPCSVVPSGVPSVVPKRTYWLQIQ